MKLQILGTAAAEGWPALFCNCSACQKARNLGGKNIRTRSSLQIDDLLKIDLPHDSLSHANRYGLGFHKLEYLLITHSHSDHLDASELEFIVKPYSVPPRYDSLHIFGNDNSISSIRKAINRSFSDYPGFLNTVEPYCSISLDAYDITAVKANHKPDENALNYIITKDNASVLYACDTGYYDSATWEFLQDKKVDLVISECTEGPRRADYLTHMGYPDVLDFREKALKVGLVDTGTTWILTHFSHGGGLMHDELEALVEPEGFRVAWDGMVVETG